MSAKAIKTKELFDAELEAGGRRLVLFYSAWCPFCVAFLPAFEKQAETAPGAFLKVCTEDLPGLEDKFSIEVVPSVLCFESGRLSARLDGQLGRGLSGDSLRAFAGTCAGGKARP